MLTEPQWIGFALVVTAAAVTALAIAGFMLAGVLARVAEALEAMRPPGPAMPRPGHLRPRTPAEHADLLRRATRLAPTQR